MPKNETLFQKQVAESGFSKEQENFLIQMNDAGVRKIEDAIATKMDERFTVYGFPIMTPLAIQKDMAFLSTARKLAESIVTKFIVIIALSLGALGLVSKIVKGP